MTPDLRHHRVFFGLRVIYLHSCKCFCGGKEGKHLYSPHISFLTDFNLYKGQIKKSIILTASKLLRFWIVILVLAGANCLTFLINWTDRWWIYIKPGCPSWSRCL